MRVNPNSEPLDITRAPGPVEARNPRLEADQQSFASAESLSRALEQTPAVRSDKVAQARLQIADPTYPPLELIKRISNLIARDMRNE